VLRLFPWQEAIYNRLVNNLKNAVFVESVSENDIVLLDNTGLVKPFVVLWFGGALAAEEPRMNAICGVVDSLHRALVVVNVIGPPSLAFLEFEDQVRSLMLGFSPAGEGELVEIGPAASVRDPAPVGIGVDSRAYKTLVYQGVVNTGASA
jgi:hypothetical protein